MAPALHPSLTLPRAHQIMKDSLRLAIFAAVMGFIISYVLWGRHPQEAPTDTPEGNGNIVRSAPKNDAKKSSLILKPALQDLGTVDPDSTHEVVFQIHNPTDQPITIDQITPGCGCVDAQMDKRVIPANAFANMTAKYSASRNKKADKVAIRIHTSEKGARYLTAYVEAIIYHEIILDPTLVNFETMPIGETKTKTFTVRHAKGLNFKILGVNCSKSYLTFKWKPEIKGVLSGYLITATCTAPPEPVTHKETCAIITDIKSQASKITPIDIMVTVRGALSVSPPSLVGRCQPDGSVKPPLGLTLKRYTAGAPIEITHIFESFSRKISYTTKEENGKLNVSLSFKDPLPADRTTTGAFLIHTKKDYKKFPLTVRYRITPSMASGIPPRKSKRKEQKPPPERSTSTKGL